MRLTQITVPRDFPEQIGFVEQVRLLLQLPTDPEMMRLFLRLAPKAVGERLASPAKGYEAPEWFAYWVQKKVPLVSDGFIKLPIPKPRVFQELVHALVSAYYNQNPDRVPFISEVDAPPTHMLLHHTATKQLFVSAFEQGESVLVRQRS